MKILYIADSTSIHTQRWLEYFLKAGNKISLITIGKNKKKLNGVQHLANFNHFYYKSVYFISVLRKTKKIIEKVKPDILHAHFVHQYGWLASLSCFKPFVLTAWGTDILKLPHVSKFKIGKLLTQHALRSADLLTGTSDYLKSEMIKLGADNDKTHVIFWGVDSTLFNRKVTTDEFRKKYGIKNDKKIVLSNRNHIALYNNDIVIKAMAKVLKKCPDSILVLQNSSGDKEKELKELAHSEGIYECVRFIPNLKYHEMPKLYAVADVYVSVPSWDAGPVSLKEAMASGAAPIISAIPGPMEWITDGVNGKIVPIRDIDKLSEAICELLQRRDLREKFSEFNVDLIKSKADHRQLMSQMEKLYRSLHIKNVKM